MIKSDVFSKIRHRSQEKKNPCPPPTRALGLPSSSFTHKAVKRPAIKPFPKKIYLFVQIFEISPERWRPFHGTNGIRHRTFSDLTSHKIPRSFLVNMQSSGIVETRGSSCDISGASSSAHEISQERIQISRASLSGHLEHHRSLWMHVAQKQRP